MPIKRPHHIANISRKKEISPGKWEFEPQGLNIVWGNDPRYWSIPENGPAGLIQVSWLEVSGSLSPVSKGEKYKIRFEVSLKADSFGWNGSQVLVMAKIGKRGSYEYKEANLSQPGDTTLPSTEGLEIEVPSTAPDPQLYFGLYEVWSGKWKGGLEIRKAIVERVP